MCLSVVLTLLHCLLVVVLVSRAAAGICIGHMEVSVDLLSSMVTYVPSRVPVTIGLGMGVSFENSVFLLHSHSVCLPVLLKCMLSINGCFRHNMMEGPSPCVKGACALHMSAHSISLFLLRIRERRRWKGVI